MSTRSRMTLEMSPRLDAALAQLVERQGPSRSDILREAINDIMEKAANDGGSRISPVSTAIIPAFSSQPSDDSRGRRWGRFLIRVWDALELKPGAFGVRLDLKRLFSRS